MAQCIPDGVPKCIICDRKTKETYPCLARKLRSISRTASLAKAWEALRFCASITFFLALRYTQTPALRNGRTFSAMAFPSAWTTSPVATSIAVKALSRHGARRGTGLRAPTSNARRLPRERWRPE